MSEKSERKYMEEERKRKNIVIRGLEIQEGKNAMREIERWLKEKLGYENRIVGCERSGEVWIVRLSREEDKREIMERKYRLRGGKEFIGHDLCWEDRRKTEEMLQWTNKQMSWELEIQIESGWLKIKGKRRDNG